MTAEFHDLSYAELLGLLAGDPKLRARLEAGESLRVATPFVYPRRQNPVIVYLSRLDEPGSSAGAPAGLVRISERGDLIRNLGEQGMELDLDMILSKTVVHAVRQVKSADLANGQVYLDCPADKLATGLWRFLQMVVEIIGLRHGKYKDAMVQLERRQDYDAGMTGWQPG